MTAETAEPTADVVVFKDYDGWFTWTTARWWDKPENQFEGKRLDKREEITRVCTVSEAHDIINTYNQMVHGSTDRYKRSA